MNVQNTLQFSHRAQISPDISRFGRMARGEEFEQCRQELPALEEICLNSHPGIAKPKLEADLTFVEKHHSFFWWAIKGWWLEPVRALLDHLRGNTLKASLERHGFGEKLLAPGNNKTITLFFTRDFSPMSLESFRNEAGRWIEGKYNTVKSISARHGKPVMMAAVRYFDGFGHLKKDNIRFRFEKPWDNNGEAGPEIPLKEYSWAPGNKATFVCHLQRK